ncbi:hypothetical protein D9M70_312960 [compost metagenome]
MSSIVPPECSSTKVLTIDSPMPVPIVSPFWLRLVENVALKIWGSTPASMPQPLSSKKIMQSLSSTVTVIFILLSLAGVSRSAQQELVIRLANILSQSISNALINGGQELIVASSAVVFRFASTSSKLLITFEATVARLKVLRVLLSRLTFPREKFPNIFI